jgi:hypothetical protein
MRKTPFCILLIVFPLILVSTWSLFAPPQQLPAEYQWTEHTRMAFCPTDYFIITSTDSGASWMEQRNPGGSRNWQSIASSSSGQMLAAVEYNGYIYISRDYGVTGDASTAAGLRTWVSVAMSSDGTRLAAVDDHNHVSTAVYR